MTQLEKRSPAPCANTENRADTSMKHDLDSTKLTAPETSFVEEPGELESTAHRLVAALWAVPIYVRIIDNYYELGDIDGVTHNMRNLVQCVRTAASVCNELNVLRASSEGGA